MTQTSLFANIPIKLPSDTTVFGCMVCGTASVVKTGEPLKCENCGHEQEKVTISEKDTN